MGRLSTQACATHSASFSISSSKLIDPVQKIFTTKITYTVFLLQNSSESYSTLQFGPESLCLSVTPIPLEEVHLLLQLFGVVGLKKRYIVFSLLVKSVPHPEKCSSCSSLYEHMRSVFMDPFISFEVGLTISCYLYYSTYILSSSYVSYSCHVVLVLRPWCGNTSPQIDGLSHHNYNVES